MPETTDVQPTKFIHSVWFGLHVNRFKALLWHNIVQTHLFILHINQPDTQMYYSPTPCMLHYTVFTAISGTKVILAGWVDNSSHSLMMINSHLNAIRLRSQRIFASLIPEQTDPKSIEHSDSYFCLWNVH